MSHSVAGTNRPQWLELHPAIFRWLIGTALWLVAAIWLAFSHDSYAALQLAMASFFVAMFIATPWLLARLNGAKRAGGSVPFSEWKHGDLQTHTGPLNGGEAAVAILTVPLAVVSAMTAISFIAYLAAMGAI